MSITEALSKIQQELKAPKGQYNSFGKYKYRNCEDILTAVKPLLDGGTVTLDDDIVMVGNRIYIKAIATFSKGGESISVKGFAREAETKKGMDESQITGSASSYARKYALNGLFAIDDTKDDDFNNNGSGNNHEPAKTSNNAVSKPPVTPSTPKSPPSSGSAFDNAIPTPKAPVAPKTPSAPSIPDAFPDF